jgi:hypothetical protein
MGGEKIVFVLWWLRGYPQVGGVDRFLAEAFGREREDFGGKGASQRLGRPWGRLGKRTSGAKANCKSGTCGTAEAVPLSKTGFFSTSLFSTFFFSTL